MHAHAYTHSFPQCHTYCTHAHTTVCTVNAENSSVIFPRSMCAIVQESYCEKEEKYKITVLGKPPLIHSLTPFIGLPDYKNGIQRNKNTRSNQRAETGQGGFRGFGLLSGTQLRTPGGPCCFIVLTTMALEHTLCLFSDLQNPGITSIFGL